MATLLDIQQIAPGVYLQCSQSQCSFDKFWFHEIIFVFGNRILQCVDSWAKLKKEKVGEKSQKLRKWWWILQNCNPHPGLSWLFFLWILKWYTCSHQRSCIFHFLLSLPCYCMDPQEENLQCPYRIEAMLSDFYTERFSETERKKKDFCLQQRITVHSR